MSNERPRLSGWCTSAPGIKPDQHHKSCRWELCQCPAHASDPVIHKGKVGAKRYNGDTIKAAQSDGVRAPSLIPGPRRSSLEGAID